MKLLVITQALDLDDPLLSVYHSWVEALARKCAQVEVICLKKGRYALPENVTVHSLGKETGTRSALAYARSFFALAWKLRRNYDTVFVHMNQEYVLVGGLLWKLLGKRVYLWRNHYAGSFLTDLAAFWCTNVFCTSRSSYTAKYKKTVFMPVGVQLERFSVLGAEARTPRSLLFFSRIAPSKHADLFIEALGLLQKRGVVFSATIAGSAPPEYEAYAESLRTQVQNLGLESSVSFVPGVRNEDTPPLYRAHELFVNCSPSGMLDKMIFEAAASGCLILSESDDLRRSGYADLTYAADDAASLAEHIQRMLDLSPEEKGALKRRTLELAETNGLVELAEKLVTHMARK